MENNKRLDHLLFPEVVSVFNINENCNYILDYLKNKIEFKPTDISLRDASAGKVFLSTTFSILDIFPSLKNTINICAKQFLEEVLGVNIDFKMQGSWATKTLKDGYCQEHHHSHSLVSGVFYLQTEKDFKIKFIKKQNNLFWDLPTTHTTIVNADGYSFCFGENNLVFFKSDMKHKIEKNISDNDRYSIAFNIVPVGRVGKNDSELYFC